MLQTNKSTKSVYLFPNSPDNNNYLIPLTEAIDLCSKYLQKHHFPQSKISSVQSEFVNLANKDLFLRVAQSRNIKEKDSKEKHICFDTIGDWMLRAWVERYKDKLASLHTVIAMAGGNLTDGQKSYDDLVYAVNCCYCSSNKAKSLPSPKIRLRVVSGLCSNVCISCSCNLRIK